MNVAYWIFCMNLTQNLRKPFFQAIFFCIRAARIVPIQRKTNRYDLCVLQNIKFFSVTDIRLFQQQLYSICLANIWATIHSSLSLEHPMACVHRYWSSFIQKQNKLNCSYFKVANIFTLISAKRNRNRYKPNHKRKVYKLLMCCHLNERITLFCESKCAASVDINKEIAYVGTAWYTTKMPKSKTVKVSRIRFERGKEIYSNRSRAIQTGSQNIWPTRIYRISFGVLIFSVLIGFQYVIVISESARASPAL